MKIKASLLAGLIALSPFAVAQGVEVATDPVGYVSVNLLAASDTRISVPMTRAPVFQGIPVSVDGSNINFAEGTGIQPENPAYFIAVRSGALAGQRATVVGVDNGGDTLIIEEGVDLSALNTGEGGDPIQLIPHWTMATLFPDDLPEDTTVLLFNPENSGINRGADQFLTFFPGFGWFDGGRDANDDIVHQGEGFVVRDSSGSDVNLVIAGSVPMFDHLTTVGTVAAGVQQDNHFGITLPAPVALGDAGIPASDGDVLLIPANELTGINKGADRFFSYFDGFGWFDGGTDVNSFELEPGVGYILRKDASETPGFVTWQYTPQYLQD